jgi:hypothetical protein
MRSDKNEDQRIGSPVGEHSYHSASEFSEKVESTVLFNLIPLQLTQPLQEENDPPLGLLVMF